MSNLFKKKPLEMLLAELEDDNRLRRILGPVSLTSLGIGAIIGVGIFVITGKVAHQMAGPAIVLSFVVSGLACVFAALCYAEFASMVPVAGSAYTYAYATLGELFAWIIGWDLVLEYTVASATVAQGWSHYFINFIEMFGIQLPAAIIKTPYYIEDNQLLGPFPYINVPVLVIAAILTMVLVKGIKESTMFNNAMVAVKLAVVLFVIVVGVFYINPENYADFAPFGYTGLGLFGVPILGQTREIAGSIVPVGVLAGGAMVFFAYIGFDSVSTHAEEAKNPQRDVPIGIITSLVICTVLYIVVSLVITGMVNYKDIAVEAPIADAFKQAGLPWAQFLISLAALTGITSVLLVLMLSGARVLLAMARDGFLPKSFFGDVHPTFKTPWKATILIGGVVGLAGALIPLDKLTELVNIGTLFAFVIVCVAVIIMRITHPDAKRPFKAPLFPYVPILGTFFCLLLMFALPGIVWLRLAVWLAVGIVIYFCYGRYHSVLAKVNKELGK